MYFRLGSNCVLLTVLVTALALGACGDTRDDGDGGVPSGDAGMMMMGDDGGMTGRDAGMLPPPSPLVDPSCTDGMFSEALPDPSADISDLEASFSEANATMFITDVLARRYSTGRDLVQGGLTARIGNCVEVFGFDLSSPSAIIGRMSTIVHECGHFYDIEQGGGGNAVYVINDSPLRFSCSGGDTMPRGGNTFARSRIRGDSYQSLRPPGRGSGMDFYADTYLDGDPDDGTFEGGDQGFNSLMEETTQYVNSLAVSYAFTNELNTGGGSSQRDGILTFLWYVMRYLRMARTDFPSAYDHIVNGSGGCFRDLILTVWGRAWLYLQTTEGMSHLGLNDDELMVLVMDADLLSEIQRLREAAGCAAP